MFGRHTHDMAIVRSFARSSGGTKLKRLNRLFLGPEQNLKHRVLY